MELSKENNLYFKQLLVGRETAIEPTEPVHQLIFPFACQMRNFIYLIGDKNTKECIVVDPCWDVQGILKIVKNDNMKIIGGIATHYHFDHCGGHPPPPFSDFYLEGVADIVKLCGENTKIYVNKFDAPMILKNTKISPSSLIETDHEQIIQVGSIKLKLLHTPGHSPGSQCIEIQNYSRLLTGDTLFIGSFGRLDLPDSDPNKLYDSFHIILKKLDDKIIVYPGHDYSKKPTTTIGQEKKTNMVFLIPSKEKFLSLL